MSTPDNRDRTSSQAPHEALNALLTEILDDVERVVDGNPGWIDRDMLGRYRADAAAYAAKAAQEPRWTERLGPVVACEHGDAPVVTVDTLKQRALAWREKADEADRGRASVVAYRIAARDLEEVIAAAAPVQPAPGNVREQLNATKTVLQETSRESSQRGALAEQLRRALEAIASAAQGSIDTAIPLDREWVAKRALSALGWAQMPEPEDLVGVPIPADAP